MSASPDFQDVWDLLGERLEEENAGLAKEMTYFGDRKGSQAEKVGSIFQGWLAAQQRPTAEDRMIRVASNEELRIKVPGKRKRVSESARDKIKRRWERVKEQFGLLTINERIGRLPDCYRPQNGVQDEELQRKYDYLRENETEIYEALRKSSIPSPEWLKNRVMGPKKPSDREWTLTYMTKFFPESYEEYVKKYGHPNKQEEDGA